ncbi:HupE/UreJ family protein [Paenisporosarcina sp. NPDC076898]|uniref:HupE/UreJ family protein n=1 Tax=unclassified Paenisporosarcina TaxID=2642018 RepID=UPI003D047767
MPIIYSSSRYFLLLLLLFSLLHPLKVDAHAYSASYTSIDIQESRTELTFTIDSLSLIELVEDVDVNGNEKIGKKELKKAEHHLEELISETLVIDKNNTELHASLEKTEIKEIDNTEFIRFHFAYEGFQPGDTLTLMDGFYVDDSATNYINLVSSSYYGETSETVIQGNERTWTKLITEVQMEQGSENASAGTHSTDQDSSWLAFFKLGAMHILTGYDHLLFLFALLLRKQTLKQYIAIVTAFTIAHSITISLSVLGMISLPSLFVEAVIALSIIYVALENIFRKEVKHRWGLTFGFGLIHGLGFASILKEMNLPSNRLFTALFNFNIGIEVVQILLVLALLPLLNYMQKQKYARQFVTYGSVLIALMGGYWLIERLFL